MMDKCKSVTDDSVKQFGQALLNRDGITAGKLLEEVGKDQWFTMIEKARNLGTTEHVPSLPWASSNTDFHPSLPELVLQKLPGDDDARLTYIMREHKNGNTSALVSIVPVVLADIHNRCEK